MLALDFVELGGADIPGAGTDRPPAIGIDLLDGAFAVIGGVLVGVVGLVILAAKDRAAGQQHQARPQHQGARGKLKADRRDHCVPWLARKIKSFQ